MLRKLRQINGKELSEKGDAPGGEGGAPFDLPCVLRPRFEAPFRGAAFPRFESSALLKEGPISPLKKRHPPRFLAKLPENNLFN